MICLETPQARPRAREKDTRVRQTCSNGRQSVYYHAWIEQKRKERSYLRKGVANAKEFQLAPCRLP